MAALTSCRRGLAAVTREHYAGGHGLGSFATYLTTRRVSVSNRFAYRKASMRDIRVATVQFQHEPAQVYNLGGSDISGRKPPVPCRDHRIPEMCLTGTGTFATLARVCRGARESVPDGPCSQSCALSREHGMTIGAGLIERASDGQLYNAYVAAMPDGRWALHRKLHEFVSEFLRR